MPESRSSAAETPVVVTPNEQPAVVIATVLASLIFLLPATLGKLVEFVVKAINPADVDVSNGLAYLRHLLIIGVIMFAVTLAMAVIAIVRLRITHGAAATRLPVIVLAVQFGLIVVWTLAEVSLNAVTE